MAIQKVSDLPIFKKTDGEFDYDKVLASLMELSYKISSDEKDNVSRYQSRAVTLKEMADFILSTQGGDDRSSFYQGIKLSGDVYLNEGIDKAVFTGYVVSANTGKVDLTVNGRWGVSAQSAAVVADSISLNVAGENVLVTDQTQLKFKTDVNFDISPTVPHIDNMSPDNVAVDKRYVDQSIPSIERTTLLFETRYLDYLDMSLSSKGWVCTTYGSWLSGDFFDETFNHLRNDFTLGTAVTISYDGVQGHPISAKLAADGHIICKADQLENVDYAFQQTGVAWIYVIDDVNKKFKLPRNARFFSGMLPAGTVGGYSQAAMPQHYHYITNSSLSHLGYVNGTLGSGCGGIVTACSNHNSKTLTLTSEAAKIQGRSNLVTTSSDTVKPQSVSMHLYMFCS